MKHFIITRFNLKYDSWTSIDSSIDVLSPEWLEKRFQIFESFCLPSVMNQSNPDFEWLILFHEKTPETYKKRIQELTIRDPRIKPVFVLAYEKMHDQIKAYIRSRITDAKFLITTRLDNDDLIHMNFIKTIQEIAVDRHDVLLDLRSGYQLSLQGNQADVRNFSAAFNPFVSLVESMDDFKTILSRNHLEWKSHNDLVIYTKTPLWIQFIHDTNLVNRKNRSLSKAISFKPEDFGLSNLNSGSFIGHFIHNIATSAYRLYLWFKRNIFDK